MKKPTRKLVVRSEAIRLLRTLERAQLELVQGGEGLVAANGDGGGPGTGIAINLLVLK